jgi:DNA primase
MISNLITNKLKAMNLSFTPSGVDYILTSCLNPAHNDKHPSFGINLTTGIGKCFSCGFKVDIDFWTGGELSEEVVEECKRSAHYSELLDTLRVEDEVSTAISVMPPPDKSKDVSTWRGLEGDLLKSLGVYHCTKGRYADRLIFPMYNFEGGVVAFNSRTLIDAKPKYLYSKGIKPKELVYPPITLRKGYIVLVEGIVDAISLVQDGIPAMYNFGIANTMSNKKIAHLLKSGVETIYIMFDKDEAGAKGALTYLTNEGLKEFFEVKLAAELPELRKFLQSEFKDYNEYITNPKYNQKED